MGKRATMQDIADRLGVSKVTVSKAIRGSSEISEDMKKRILETAEEIGYRYEAPGKSLPEGQNLCIGIITSDRYFGQGDYFYVDLYRLLTGQLEELGYSAMLHILDQKSEKGLMVPAMLPEGRVDGVIMLGQVSREYLNEILSYDLPVVFLDFYCDRIDRDTDCIITDNFFGAYEITNTLIDQGHKNIGYVGNLNLTSSIQDRFLGFCKSIMEHKLAYRHEWLINDRDDDGRWIDIRLPEEMPTAFVCNCDKTAAMVIKKLKEEGYKVPEDLSVVGFDDSVDSRMSDPQITTVRVDIEHMAGTAARIITKKTSNKEKAYGRVLIKGSVVERKSAAVWKGESSICKD